MFYEKKSLREKWFNRSSIQMILHFAGSDGAEKYNQILTDVGATGRLESYYTLKDKAPSKDGFKLLLDSGGFVARTKGKTVSVHQLSRYINKHQLKYAFNLDTNDVKETLENQKFLESNCECYIIPIYHLSDYLNERELLQDFLKYPYIAIGGVAGEGSAIKLQHEFYKYVFRHTADRVAVHGLGITSKRILELYPFYSVDSTSWLSAARFGNVSTTENKYLIEYYKKKVHYLINTKREAEQWVRVQHYITQLWIKRGVTWIQ